MGFAQIPQQRACYYLKFAATIAAVFLAVLPSSAQSKAASQQRETPWAQELKNHPELLAEFGRLFEKLKQNIQFPAPRTESRLLPLLPPPTMSYAAFANYGDVAQQALKIFRQELQESAVLRDWGNTAI